VVERKLIVPRLLGTRYVLAFDTYRFGSRTATHAAWTTCYVNLCILVFVVKECVHSAGIYNPIATLHHQGAFILFSSSCKLTSELSSFQLKRLVSPCCDDISFRSLTTRVQSGRE